MRLSKLEINGFKTFARKTELVFLDGITAIVGPNGSGKSNVADAIRWVLGEQSSKILRGDKMEDVIFHGTENKKPQSYCEVTLTFDNSDGQLELDYTEISVTRRVFRSGESEYCINNSNCRLKDVRELFRDTGIGKEGYSIIGQGKVEEILSNKSNDRRAAIEEAAGIMKYRARNEEAQRKLENTKKNLERLTDILVELEAQLGPLEEQSKTAREYLKLRDELKAIEINVFLYEYEKNKEKIKNFTELKNQLTDEVDHSAQITASIESDCIAEEERERRLSSGINDLQNRLLALTSGAETHFGDTKVIDERLANISAEKNRIIEAIAGDTERANAISSEIAELQSTEQAAGAKLAEGNALIVRITNELNELEKNILNKETVLEEQKASVIEAMNKLADAKSRISHLSAIKETLKDRLLAIAEEEKQLLSEEGSLKKEHLQVDTIYQDVLSSFSEIQAEKNKAVVRQNELNQTLIQTNAGIKTLEQTTQTAQSRIKVLNEMRKAYEGYYSTVRNLFKDAETSLELKKTIDCVVAEAISVPKQFEAAIEMALGSVLQNIITPTEETAKQVIAYLRKMNYGRATLLPISAMRPRLLSAQERETIKVPGCLGVASDLVSSKPIYRGIVENLLGRTVIVENIDVGIKINKAAKFSFRIATVGGDIINPGGSITGGSLQKREFSLLGREREINELSAKYETDAKQLETLKLQLEAQEKEFADAYKAVNDLQINLHAKEIELATQKEKLDIVIKYVELNNQQRQKLENERSQINDNIKDILSQSDEAENMQVNIEQGNLVSREDIKRGQEELYVLRNSLNSVFERLTAQKIARAAEEKETSIITNDIRRLMNERQTLIDHKSKSELRIAELDKQHSEISGELLSLGKTLTGERAEIDAVSEQIKALEEERASNMKLLDELRQRRDGMTDELDDKKERLHKADLGFSKAEMELNNIQDRIWEDYELTYDNALIYKQPIAVTASHLRVDQLKKEIRDLGDVNVTSIADYKNVSERHTAMNAQINDLTRAEEDLQLLIEELENTMTIMFYEKFRTIQENFAQVFSELFGGGRAELLLSDSKDMLNCNIEILAQPPGKKLQHLEPLSGGERALTAIALLFAILKIKPSPFCVLDEIDTSLDEMNVSIFAEYLKNYANYTQFLLITHKKGSMEVCNSLYGVAMEEKGISKIVSARFEEAS